MSLNLDDLQKEHERMNQDGSADFLANFVKMPEGNGHVTVRMLPPAAAGAFERKKNPFYQATRVHRVNNKSLHCLRTLENGKWRGDCPICDYYNWLWRESERKSPEEAKSMQSQARAIKPIERYYYNVLVRSQYNEQTGETEKNVGPKILSVGKTIHKMIIRAIVGDPSVDEPALGDVTDPKVGRDFKIIKTLRQSGTESYPNYDTSKFLDESVLGDPDEVKKWLAGLHDIVALRHLREADEMKHELKVHLGIEKDEATGFDPTEFQTASTVDTNSEVSATVTVVDEQTGNSVTEEVSVNNADSGDVVDSSQPMDADEFVAELKKLGQG